MILCCKEIYVFILKIIFSELFTCHSILILRICQILWLVWFSEKYYYTLKQFDIKSVKLVGDRPKEKKYETTFFLNFITQILFLVFRLLLSFLIIFKPPLFLRILPVKFTQQSE